jgi:hypothetical protein
MVFNWMRLTAVPGGMGYRLNDFELMPHLEQI